MKTEDDCILKSQSAIRTFSNTSSLFLLLTHFNLLTALLLKQKSNTPTSKILHSLLLTQYKIHSIKKILSLIKYSTKVISTTGEVPSELSKKLVSSIDFAQQAFKSLPKHVRESTDAVVWEAVSADSLKDAKLFLSSLPNIRLHGPVFLNPTITVLGLPTWVSNEELQTSFNLLFPSADFSAFHTFEHKPNARNSFTRDWFIQVSSTVFPMLSKSKNVHLLFGRLPFHSCIHQTRCLNYQIYGYKITKCHNPRVCEHCNKDHLSNNCFKTSPPFCIFCFKSKRSFHDHVTTFSFVLFIDNNYDYAGMYDLAMKTRFTHVASKSISSSEVWLSHFPFHSQQIHSYPGCDFHSFFRYSCTD